jgi:hypothetical protein
MILPRQLLDHETLMLATLTIAREIAGSLGVSPDAPLAEVCRAVGASRTSVYEQVKRVLASLEDLASARPGRPRAPEPTRPSAAASTAQQLTIEILEHRLEHPGAMVRHRGRTHYSPELRRLVLARHDAWTDSLEAFAAAVRVPLDTLRDWLQRDRQAELAEPVPEVPTVLVPHDASELSREVAELWQAWQGPTRAFFGHAAQRFDLSTAQVARLLRVLGCIAPRRRKPPRYRGATQPLSPGAMLVTDGKQVDVELTGSGRKVHRNWQGIVDQATGCDTAVVITAEECAEGVREAYDGSLDLLAGVVPEGLLHDNKPCYDDANLRCHVEQCGTTMIPATLRRAENKAILEGAFGLWEQRVGTVRLDDTTTEALISSAVAECVRAYTAATNSVPRVDCDGRSRLDVLHETCPSAEQQQRDRDFLRRLKADHDPPRRRLPRPNPVSAALLDAVFSRLGLLDKDPKGALRRYLAVCEPAAIRRAAAIVAARREAGSLEQRYLHRYLAKVIESQQDEIELERAADELLELCRLENQLWTAGEEQDYERLVEDGLSRDELVLAVAERAAHAGLPVQAAHWTRKLTELLRPAIDGAQAVKQHLIRLYEAAPQRRLQLIDQITALQHGLA